MQASYMESSFYNMYYKNSTINNPNGGNKKIRFANDTGDQDDSNFGLEVPSLEGVGEINQLKPGFNAKTQLKKSPKNENPHNITNLSQIDNMAGEVLVNCNAVVSKSKYHNQILMKGDGKTIAGSGKTNYEIYSQIMHTF